MSINVPNHKGLLLKRKLLISAPGARSKPYVKSLTINGIKIEKPIIKHAQLVGWESEESGEIRVEYEMSDRVEMWGNDKEVLDVLGVVMEVEKQNRQHDEL
jgi:putative alpha-1,2-mannosidase